MSFWHTLPQPIIGLSPMDGVTDAACRFIMAQHGKPDVQCTEFVSVEEIPTGQRRHGANYALSSASGPSSPKFMGLIRTGFTR